MNKQRRNKAQNRHGVKQSIDLRVDGKKNRKTNPTSLPHSQASCWTLDRQGRGVLLWQAACDCLIYNVMIRISRSTVIWCPFLLLLLSLPLCYVTVGGQMQRSLRCCSSSSSSCVSVPRESFLQVLFSSAMLSTEYLFLA